MSESPVRIALIDDHTLFRESLRRLLETGTRFAVVAEASTAQQGLELARGSLPFDLALIDYELGADEVGANGLTVLRSIRQRRPGVPCLMVTAGLNEAALHEVVHAQQASIFFKSEPAAELLLALEKTVRGEQWISSEASVALLRSRTEEEQATRSSETVFLPRELQVLSFITQGLSNKEIGAKLDLTESSVKAMLQKLFAKTSVRSRSQLVRFVFESELELP
jgi:DNA-binding NarL/FixJ family response regulator